MCWTCSKSFTRSIGATVVFEMAAATPPAIKSWAKPFASKPISAVCGSYAGQDWSRLPPSPADAGRRLADTGALLAIGGRADGNSTAENRANRPPLRLVEKVGVSRYTPMLTGVTSFRLTRSVTSHGAATEDQRHRRHVKIVRSSNADVVTYACSLYVIHLARTIPKP